MQSFSFIHTADLHLDSPFKNITNDPWLKDKLKNASLDCFKRLIDLAISRKVDFILFAGDIYDGREVGLRAQHRFLEGLKLASEHNIKSYILLGNHDAKDIFSSISDWPSGVHFFSNEHLDTFTFEKNCKPLAEISGISFNNSFTSKDILSKFKKNIENKLFSIGLYHGDVSSSLTTTLDSNLDKSYASCSMNDLLSVKGIDYWALGHIHQYKLLRNSNPLIAYSGTIQGRSLKPSECGSKGIIYCSIENNTDFSPNGESSSSNTKNSNFSHEFIALSKIEFNELRIRPDENPSLLSLSDEVSKRIKDNISSLKNSEDYFNIIRIILEIKAKNVKLFSGYNSKEKFLAHLREIFDLSNIYITECIIEIKEEANSEIVKEIISHSKDYLENLSEEKKISYFEELFSIERKLQNISNDFSINEIESRAIEIIKSKLLTYEELE